MAPEAHAHGAILVDKPAGLSSAQVVSRLKHRFKFDKIGHSGTLDPDATGLLVVLVGKATRLQDLFLGATKGYRGTIRLGVTTTTDDLAGEVLTETCCDSLGDQKARELLLAPLVAHFTGAQLQRPPAYSALKVDGTRSYQLARKGAEVVLTSRPIEIYSLSLAWGGEQELRYQLRCSKGTYVRSLARDIGERLGVGGTIATIHRDWSAPFSVDEATPLDELSEESLPGAWRSLDQLTAALPRVELAKPQCDAVRQGLQWPLAQLPVSESPAALFEESGTFRGVLELDGDCWRVRFLM